jgi:cell division protein ZapA (FtsZ GTPase activity inhibitor)
MSNPHGSFVQFYTDSIEIKAESEKAGRPIYRDVPHIRKMTPGDGSNIVERVAKQFDFDMYQREWQTFQRQQQTPMSGTPLEQWPQITRAQVKESKYFEVHTVEQMAELSDASCQRLGMGFADLRMKARVYLEAANATADLSAKEAENARLQQEIDNLKQQMAELAPRRGRPPKIENEEA